MFLVPLLLAWKEDWPGAHRGARFSIMFSADDSCGKRATLDSARAIVRAPVIPTHNFSFLTKNQRGYLRVQLKGRAGLARRSATRKPFALSAGLEAWRHGRGGRAISSAEISPRFTPEAKTYFHPSALERWATDAESRW